MKYIGLFENKFTPDTIKEFNQDIRRHPLEQIVLVRLEVLLKHLLVTNIEYGHV